MRYARGRAIFAVFIITMLFGALFFVIGYGMYMVQTGQITAGELIAFVTYTAIIGGSIVFGLTYGVSCLVALISMTFERNEGLLMAVPIVGPAIWGALYDDELTTALILSGGQLLGAALLTYGVARANASEEERVALRVTPVLTAQVQGLIVSGAL